MVSGIRQSGGWVGVRSSSCRVRSKCCKDSTHSTHIHISCICHLHVPCVGASPCFKLLVVPSPSPTFTPHTPPRPCRSTLCPTCCRCLLLVPPNPPSHTHAHTALNLVSNLLSMLVDCLPYPNPPPTPPHPTPSPTALNLVSNLLSMLVDCPRSHPPTHPTHPTHPPQRSTLCPTCCQCLSIVPVPTHPPTPQPTHPPPTALNLVSNLLSMLVDCPRSHPTHPPPTPLTHPHTALNLVSNLLSMLEAVGHVPNGARVYYINRRWVGGHIGCVGS